MSLKHKVLRSLVKAPLTVDEIAESVHEERKRVAQNMSTYIKEGVLKRIMGLDQTLEYHITVKGTEWLKSAGWSEDDAESVVPVPESTETAAPIAAVPVAESWIVESFSAEDDAKAAALAEQKQEGMDAPGGEAVPDENQFAIIARPAPRGYVISHPTEGMMSSTFDSADDEQSVMAYAADLCRDSGVTIEVFRFEAVLVGKYVPSAVFIQSENTPEEALA